MRVLNTNMASLQIRITIDWFQMATKHYNILFSLSRINALLLSENDCRKAVLFVRKLLKDKISSILWHTQKSKLFV